VYSWRNNAVRASSRLLRVRSARVQAWLNSGPGEQGNASAASLKASAARRYNSTKAHHSWQTVFCFCDLPPGKGIGLGVIVERDIGNLVIPQNCLVVRSRHGRASITLRLGIGAPLERTKACSRCEDIQDRNLIVNPDDFILKKNFFI